MAPVTEVGGPEERFTAPFGPCTLGGGVPGNSHLAEICSRRVTTGLGGSSWL